MLWSKLLIPQLYVTNSCSTYYGLGDTRSPSDDMIRKGNERQSHLLELLTSGPAVPADLLRSWGDFALDAAVTAKNRTTITTLILRSKLLPSEAFVPNMLFVSQVAGIMPCCSILLMFRPLFCHHRTMPRCFLQSSLSLCHYSICFVLATQYLAAEGYAQQSAPASKYSLAALKQVLAGPLPAGAVKKAVAYLAGGEW